MDIARSQYMRCHGIQNKESNHSVSNEGFLCRHKAIHSQHRPVPIQGFTFASAIDIIDTPLFLFYVHALIILSSVSPLPHSLPLHSPFLSFYPSPLSLRYYPTAHSCYQQPLQKTTVSSNALYKSEILQLTVKPNFSYKSQKVCYTVHLQRHTFDDEICLKTSTCDIHMYYTMALAVFLRNAHFRFQSSVSTAVTSASNNRFLSCFLVHISLLCHSPG